MRTALKLAASFQVSIGWSNVSVMLLLSAITWVIFGGTGVAALAHGERQQNNAARTNRRMAILAKPRNGHPLH